MVPREGVSDGAEGWAVLRGVEGWMRGRCYERRRWKCMEASWRSHESVTEVSWKRHESVIELTLTWKRHEGGMEEARNCRGRVMEVS